MATAEAYVMNDAQRSPRSMNHMDPETKLVHARLEEWAKWAKDSGIAGYPRQSLTEKAAQYGKLGIPQQSSYKAEPMMPDRVALVDAAISRLGDIDRKAVSLYYLNWEPVEVLARRMHVNGMRVLQFQRVLHRARWRIMGYLDAVG